MASIAVVEDHTTLRTSITRWLENRGHTVVSYGSLRPAMAALIDEPPDLLITDVVLPDGSGLELVARLRDVHSNAFPVIITSGLQTEEDYKRGFVAGATDYIGKPFRRQELLAKSDMHLARRRGANTEFIDLDLPGGRERAFGRYRIQGVVGRGAHGLVYSAIDSRTEQQVALKILSSVGSQSDARLRFLREIYSLSAVANPHIVSVSDFGVSEGRLYFAMEQIPGPTLREKVLLTGSASPEEASALLLGLARALSAMHRNSILHRDVSPTNILLRDGEWDKPVLIDFGLAKRPFDHGITHDNLLMGTPGYLDPSLVEDGEPTVQGDLFSLGMVTRYALTGAGWLAEYQGMKRVAAMAQSPVLFPADLPANLRILLLRLTRRDREQRPSSADEVVVATLAREGHPVEMWG